MPVGVLNIHPHFWGERAVETGSHCVLQADQELLILPFESPVCYNCRPGPPHLTFYSQLSDLGVGPSPDSIPPSQRRL